MSDPAPEIDLRQAARVLGRDRRFKKFADLVSRYFDVVSARLDIEYAQKQLGLGATISNPGTQPLLEERRQDEGQALTVGALVTSAIILYGRATQTTSKHRRPIPIVSRYDDQQKAAHDRLLRLRNDAIAHYGPAEDHIDGYWAREKITLSVGGEGPTLHHRYSRANYRQNVMIDLAGLLPIANQACTSIAEERKQQLFGELEELTRYDDFVPKLCEFAFVEQEEALRRAPGEMMMMLGPAKPRR